MKAAASSTVIAIGLLAAIGAWADDEGRSGRRASRASKPSWEFEITAYPTQVRGGDHYTSAIAAADRGPLHLEARYSYEQLNATSAFVGWTFSGGDTVSWEITPLLGGVWGSRLGYVPGFEASVAWKRIDVYIEAEYVSDRRDRNESFTYAWSELGFKALDWLRVGLAGQRTRVYRSEREIVRGPFAQASFGRATLGAYWFNPGASDQVFVGSIALSF
jgi:hypothetical protein